MDNTTRRLLAILEAAPTPKLRGEILRQWRARSGMTQQEAGEAIGLGRAMICLCESGDRSLSPAHAAALVDAFLDASAVELAIRRMTREQRKVLAAQVGNEIEAEQERASASK